jgi:Domain of Unknown Function (DUF1080)
MRSVVAFGLWHLLVSIVSAEPPELAANLLVRQGADGEIAGWKSYHPEPAAKTGEVWQLQSAGVLVCKGQPLGYLYTDQDYTNFVLKLQWRWPPGGKAGNGGVLVRMTGPHRVWPKSLEAQLNAGEAGDFWGLAGYQLSGPAERMKVLEHPKFGKLTNLKKTAELEKPIGEWNDYEIAVDGGKVTLKVNGQVVNQTTDCEVVPGKILLTAEGDEYHFRKVQLLAK